MKNFYLLIVCVLMVGVMFAQKTAPQYTSKYNAKHGIIKINNNSQTQTVEKPLQLKGTKAVFFSDGFESGDLATGGWSEIDNDGDGETWFVFDGTGSTPPGSHTGTYCATSASWTSSAGAFTPDNYLITPAIDLSTASGTVFLDWYVRAQDQTWPSEYYEVLISTTGATVGDFSTSIYDETVQAAGTDGNYYWKRSVDISSYAGQTIYIAFHHCAPSYDMFRMNIDDVEVYENTVIDAGITAITAPDNASSCTLTASEPVTITIFNYGGAAISNFPVTYNAGAGPVTETVSTSIAPASSYDYTFSQTADLSALGYYSISANISLTGDSDGSNDNFSKNVTNGDGYIDVSVTTDDQGGQSWEILNSSNDVIATHGAYQWNVTETTRVCVLDNDCYTFNWYGGTSNTVTVSYNGTQVDQTTATGDYSVYAIGGNCNAIDASLAALTFPNYETPNTNVDITGTVRNVGTSPITSFDVNYTVDGGSPVGVYSVTGINISTGNTYDFTHNIPFNQSVEATYNIEVTISNVNGGTDGNQSNNVLSKNILITSSLIQRKVVWEEFSTESCPNCPPVIDDMLAYEATQPNMVMMVHHSGYYTDFLTIPESESPGIMDLYNDGGSTYAPAGMADRYYNGQDNDADGTVDPGPVFWPGSGYGEAYIDNRVQDPAFVSVNIGGSYNSSTNALDVTVYGNFLTDFTQTIGVSLWIIEDNIQESSSGQAGATTTPWIHQHSVRDVITDVWGDQITTATTSGANYSKTYSYTVDNSWVENELYLVAFVNDINASDVNDRAINNASEVKLMDIQPVGKPNYVITNDIHMFPNPTTGIVRFMNVKKSNIQVYNILGEQIMNIDAQNSFEQIDLSNYDNGTYIVKITTNGNVLTSKVVLDK